MSGRWPNRIGRVRKRKSLSVAVGHHCADLGRGVHAGAAQPVVQYFLQRAAELWKRKNFSELFHFSWLAFIYIILAVYAFYLQQVLIINWRRWLTNEYIDEWLNHKTYYRLQMFGTATDNPDQRISEDVRMFVEYTLRFGIGILKAFTTFASFVVILYNLSGPLQFKLAGMDIHIPLSGMDGPVVFYYRYLADL